MAYCLFTTRLQKPVLCKRSGSHSANAVPWNSRSENATKLGQTPFFMRVTDSRARDLVIRASDRRSNHPEPLEQREHDGGGHHGTDLAAGVCGHRVHEKIVALVPALALVLDEAGGHRVG